jgi:hypothetical protein
MVYHVLLAELCVFHLQYSALVRPVLVVVRVCLTVRCVDILLGPGPLVDDLLGKSLIARTTLSVDPDDLAQLRVFLQVISVNIEYADGL